jgi:hypothetical protein
MKLFLLLALLLTLVACQNPRADFTTAQLSSLSLMASRTSSWEKSA